MSRLTVNPEDPNGHVTLNTFGLRTTTTESQFDHLIHTLDAVRPTVAEMLTRKAYQTDYGIFDHNGPTTDPFDLVRMHPKEDIVEGGPARTWMRKYVNLRLGDVTQLSLTDFLELPFPAALFTLELAESKSVQGNGIARDIERNLGLR